MAIETSIMEAQEWAMLNDRQKSHAEAIAELALEYGMFDQSSLADGAHYAPAAKNPFVAEGLKCGNCIFFNEANNQCQVVTGQIEADAVCKLWIIPQSVLSPDMSQLTEADLNNMTPQEIMQAKSDGRLVDLLGN
jgi:hypothetical protein